MSLMRPENVKEWRIGAISITILFKKSINGIYAQESFTNTERYKKCKTYEQVYNIYQGGMKNENKRI